MTAAMSPSTLAWILHEYASSDRMGAIVPKTSVSIIAAALFTVSPAFAQNAAFIKTIDAEIRLWTDVARQSDVKFEQ